MSTSHLTLTLQDKGRISPSETSGFSISITGRNLAELFWYLDGEEQSAFFEKLGEIKKCEGFLFDMQMFNMQEHLGDLAKAMLVELADEVRS